MASIRLLSEEDKALINVRYDSVQSYLYYSTEEDRRYAEVSIEIRVLEIDCQFTKTVRRDFSVESDFEGSYMNQDVFTHIEELEVVPGNFEVIVTVADRSSGRAVTRESEASIPDPDNPEINLTTVRLLGKAAGEEEEAPFFPITKIG